MADDTKGLLASLGQGLRSLFGTGEPPECTPVIRTNGMHNPREQRIVDADRALAALLGVECGQDGRFRYGGYSFTTLEQAAGFATRRDSLAPRSRPVAPPPTEMPRSPVVKAPAASNVQWLAQPTEITVGELRFTTDLVYFGKGDRYAHPTNNALIDPALRVAPTGDPQGTTMSYWPHYAQLDPRARRTYLEWLAGGRADPVTPIGYVFIFFYGLERRLIHDQAHAEADVILGEVVRLLELYGANYSFRSYAEKLLDAGDVLRDEQPRVEPSLALSRSYEIPLGLRVQIGKRLKAGEPIGATDALSWVLTFPDTYLRTAASRCFEELRDLWEIRFAERYPNGLQVKPPKYHIAHAYRAASGNFSADFSIKDLPDIGATRASIGKLRELLQACTDELDALSRLLGRKPDARGSMAAAALAPAPLRDKAGGPALRQCIDSLERYFDGGLEGVVQVQEILRLLQIEHDGTDKVSVPLQREMATLLELLDYGFEPDRRYGAAAPLVPNGRMLLFRSAGGAKVEPDRPGYAAARTMVDISALAAHADGIVVPVELESIARDLTMIPGLDEVERVRLLARAKAMLDDPPKRREALKRLGQLPEEHRRRVTRAAVSAVLADGRVTPAEVKFLESLHETLGLPKDDVYLALHRHSVADDEPVSVIDEARSDGVLLPVEPSKDEGAVSIDEQRLARIRSETLAVSEMLAGIFVEDEEQPIPQPARAPQPASRFVGLDAAHAELLWSVVSEPLTRPEFEEYARRGGLLADGALETINEWGFETFDEAVLEDGELIYACEHLLPRLTELGALQ